MAYVEKEMNIKRSFVEYKVTQPSTHFAIPFEFVEAEQNLRVRLNGSDVEDLGYSFLVANNVTVQVTPAIPDGTLSISRETNIDENLYKFTAGALFEARTMDKNFEQIRHSQQEVRDAFDFLEYNTLGVVEAAKSATKLAKDAAQVAYDAAEHAVDKIKLDAEFVVDGNENQHQINSSLIRTVKNINDLALISNPKNKQIIYVESIQKIFIYDENLTLPENGVTVIGNWEMEIQEAYYASWFATPNVTESQSLKLQIGYAYATSKGRSFIIDDLFYVTPVTPADTHGNRACLHVLSNSTLIFKQSVGKLKLISNNMTNYYLISTYLAKNFAVFYPDLEGDRKTHDYSSGGTHEWGHGIAVYECENGYIFRPKIYEMTGDGIYVGKSWSNATHNVPKNITIIEPEVHHVRRNGLSFTAWDNVKVIRPKIGFVGDSDGVGGAFPKSCIDVEPETEGDVYKSYGKAGVIESPYLHDSYAGIYVYCPYYTSKFNLNFTGVTHLINILNTALGFFKDVYAVDGEITFDEVYIDPIPYQAVAMWWDSTVGNIAINIKHLNCSERLGNIMLYKHPTNTSKKFGNVNINATVKGYTAIGIGQNLSDYVVDSLIMTTTPQSTNNFSLYTANASYTPKFGGRTFIKSEDSFVHIGWSANSQSMLNEVWQSPPDATTQVFINTANDFRVLKIGLTHNVSTVGEGCNIQGLNLKIDGATRTRAHTKTLGGWLKFQNSSGLTKILDSYGVWTFSA